MPQAGLSAGAQIGGPGYLCPEHHCDRQYKCAGSRQIAFAIKGANRFLAKIFPTNSIFHHRMDYATTGLPVDTSPAAPIYSGYLSETVKPFFGNTSNSPFFPNGIRRSRCPIISRRGL